MPSVSMQSVADFSYSSGYLAHLEGEVHSAISLPSTRIEADPR